MKVEEAVNNGGENELFSKENNERCDIYMSGYDIGANFAFVSSAD